MTSSLPRTKTELRHVRTVLIPDEPSCDPARPGRCAVLNLQVLDDVDVKNLRVPFLRALVTWFATPNGDRAYNQNDRWFDASDIAANLHDTTLRQCLAEQGLLDVTIEFATVDACWAVTDYFNSREDYGDMYMWDPVSIGEDATDDAAASEN